VDAFFSGLFYVNISATDTNGLMTNRSYIIDIDNMPPMIMNTNVTYPPGQAAVKFGDQIRVIAMAFDMGFTGGILGVIANLSAINGSVTEPMYDDGQHGDSFEGDGVYGSAWVTVGTHSNGFTPLPISAYDNAMNSNFNFVGINLDNTVPRILKIKIDYPAGRAYAMDGDRINVTANIMDDQGPGALGWYYLDASGVGGSEQMTNTSMFRWDGIRVSVGYTRSSPYVTVHAFDHAENEGTQSAVVEVADRIRREPTVTVKSPNGGENWMEGDFYPITWVADGNLGPKPINLYFSTDNGQTWKPIAIDIPNTGYYNWTVPNEETPSALIRVNVTDIYDINVSDTSDASFSIDPPPPTWNEPTPTANNDLIETDQEVTPAPVSNDQETNNDKTADEDSSTAEKKNSSDAGDMVGLGLAVGIVLIGICLTIIILLTLFSLLRQRKRRKALKNARRRIQQLKNGRRRTSKDPNLIIYKRLK
ncbi:LapA family protein, partial [[Eubacterium] cellulosolvens]